MIVEIAIMKKSDANMMAVLWETIINFQAFQTKHYLLFLTLPARPVNRLY
jgi:hypothetical protein